MKGSDLLRQLFGLVGTRWELRTDSEGVGKRSEIFKEFSEDPPPVVIVRTVEPEFLSWSRAGFFICAESLDGEGAIRLSEKHFRSVYAMVRPTLWEHLESDDTPV